MQTDACYGAIPYAGNGGKKAIRIIAGLFLALSACSGADAAQYYVSPTGNDGNAGTMAEPYGTFPKAISVAVPGDTIVARGGTYTLSTAISVSKSGSSGSRFFFLAYPGEYPVLNFSSMNVADSNRGIKLSGSFWYIKGLDIKGAGDNGMFMSGSHNVIEFCAFHGNHDTGLQLGGGASDNQIINCDSYDNADPGQGNADGFAPKLDVGTGNYFFGCRSWYNSDDGWDGYLRPSDDVTTTLENCWCFANGYLSNGGASSGNGNGFKMGGSDSKNLKHNMILRKCLSFYNRVKGYDQNHTRGSITLLNCTAYSNGTNFSVPETLAVSAGKVLTVENCISAGTGGVTLLNPVLATDSWTGGFAPPGDADFLSLDTAGVRAPRKSDGSLPDILFMHLAPGSQFIDAGTDVGLPYAGSSPDLGAFETGLPLPIQLAALSATSISGSRVQLTWATLSETNNYGFYVQRRAAGESAWTDVPGGFVAGNGTSTGTHPYTFVDATAGAGSWFYRLKQVDLDGSAHFSDPVFVGVLAGVDEGNAPGTWGLGQNYPNPFNPSTVIPFVVSRTGPATLEVFTVLGQRVQTLFDGVADAGRLYSVELRSQSLAAGVYFYRLRSGDQTQTKKLMVLK